MSHLVDEILRAQKRGEVRGITSICSAHPWVLKTALRGRRPVLIESTCNQVNQFGGYTGMNPLDFASFVRRLAAENNFPPERIILGGDHLGPSPWQDETSEGAMTHAVGMVQAYIQAGFTKIHLDTSMRLGGDNPAGTLDFGLVAQRTALLVNAAEAVSSPSNSSPLYHRYRSSTPGGSTLPRGQSQRNEGRVPPSHVRSYACGIRKVQAGGGLAARHCCGRPARDRIWRRFHPGLHPRFGLPPGALF